MMRKACLAIACLMMCICPVMAEGVTTTITLNTIVNETFDGSFSDYWYRAMDNNAYAGTYSTNYTDGMCYRFENHNNDPMIEDGMRSELEGPREAQFGEHVYNFSVLLPAAGSGEEWAMDNVDADEIIIQWHNNPDENLNEEWTMPSLALTTNTVNGEQHYILFNLWDDAANTTTEKMDAEGKILYFDLGPIGNDKGNWTEWSFHVKWGWLPEHNTILEVYHNGVLVLERNGLPNTTNDVPGVNQQFGCYKWEWSLRDLTCISNLDRRVIYFDNVTVSEVIRTTSVVFPGYTSPATDPDNDGIYEDLNGNGMKDYDDVSVYYSQMNWITANAPIEFFDFNGNNMIDFDDVSVLYGEV